MDGEKDSRNAVVEVKYNLHSCGNLGFKNKSYMIINIYSYCLL